MISVEKLKETTNDFFKEFCNIDGPTWSEKWKFEGELPHNTKKGCYAHLKGNEVVYVGLAIGNSFDGSGIGARVSKYWKKSENYSVNKQVYLPTVKDVDSIITLPFEPDNFYLAAALEVYLIQKLKPIKNKIHSIKK
ncbi:hypothetical protein [Litoribaculum gwangyangense]|uniref:GIY-YIG domain-containing protein n=1 Tax=Litoribaculum gwangyangense TaxID=1130722 RepID=A0ABP9C3U9_9FLAO